MSIQSLSDIYILESSIHLSISSPTLYTVGISTPDLTITFVPIPGAVEICLIFCVANSCFYRQYRIILATVRCYNDHNTLYMYVAHPTAHFSQLGSTNDLIITSLCAQYIIFSSIERMTSCRWIYAEIAIFTSFLMRTIVYYYPSKWWSCMQ